MTLLWKQKVEKCIFYLIKHLKSLKSPVPFSLPSCFLSDNNLFQVELPWLAALYHTFGLGKWSLEVFVKYFLIIHKLVPDWSRLQQNTKFTPACNKSSEPCFRELTFRDYYDLQTCYITEVSFLWNLMISLWITGWYYVNTFDKHSWKRHIWRNDFKHEYFGVSKTTKYSSSLSQFSMSTYILLFIGIFIEQ